MPETRLDYAPLPAYLRQLPPLPDLPAPAVRDDADCKDGCFTGKQVHTAIGMCLDTLSACYDNLDETGGLSDAAVATNKQ